MKGEIVKGLEEPEKLNCKRSPVKALSTYELKKGLCSEAVKGACERCKIYDVCEYGKEAVRRGVWRSRKCD